jgi:hypothetical protein
MRGTSKLKNFLKMAFVAVMAVFLFGAGFYLTIANTSQLLAAGKPNMQCRWLSSGLQIKTAKWCETLDLPSPVHVRNQSGKWLIYNRNFALTVNTKPLQIHWEKTDAGRKKELTDEY